jgi:hypothetical protein
VIEDDAKVVKLSASWASTTEVAPGRLRIEVASA